MNLNMDEVHKLNPPGLHNLRPMLVVVEVLMGLIAKEMPGSRMMLKLVRALARYQKQARDNEAYNLNVRIKAWVMAVAERRSWVRSVIGEAAIRRWQVRCDNLYGGRDVGGGTARRRPTSRHDISNLQTRPYDWKRFVMADLNWLRLEPLDVRPVKPIANISGRWPREARPFKPLEFWAFELAEDYQPPIKVRMPKEPAPTEPYSLPKSGQTSQSNSGSPGEYKPP